MLDPVRPYPRPWPDEGDRATLADGDELEIMTRAVGHDAVARKAEARAVAAPVDPGVALDYLANLSRLWEDAAPERRQQIAGALFERIDVLGLKEATIHPSPEAVAHGWRAAWGDDVLTGTHRGDYGRGERSQTSITDLSVRSRRLDCALIGTGLWLVPAG
jgi:hypothetical protein